MSGQLGDVPPPSMASPKKQPPSPAPLSTPAAVDSKPVVEAANQTPPETKVEPSSICATTPDLNPSTESIAPETPQSNEQEQIFANESGLEDINQPHLDLAAPPAEQQQSNSEKVAEDIKPEIEPCDTDQQEKNATVAEILATEQHPCSTEKAAEGHPEMEMSNVEQQAHSALVIEIPAAQQQQTSSEKAAEDLSLSVEGEMQKLLTNTGLDTTAVPAEVETEPNPQITQAAALLTENEKVEPTSEKLPEVTENSDEPKPAMIHEAVTHEVAPVQPDNTPANVTEKKIVQISSDVPQLQYPVASIQADTKNVDQTDISTKAEADSVTSPNVTEERITEVISEAPVDKVDLPEPDKSQQELNPELEKCVELTSVSLVSEQPAPTEDSTVVDKPIDRKKEPPTHDNTDKTPPVASHEEESKAPEKINEESKLENLTSLEVINFGETAKQTIPEGADEKTLGEMTNAAAERPAGVKTELKAPEQEATEQKTVKEAEDQRSQEYKANKAESTPALSCTKLDNICPVIEKKESVTAGELVSTVPEEMPKVEKQMHKETEQETKSKPAGENPAETLSLSETAKETEKSVVEAESASQTEEKQTPEKTLLKADDKTDKAMVITALPPPYSAEQEKVNIEEPLQGVETVIISETQAKDKASEGKVIHDKTEAGSQKTNTTAENQHEVERETLVLTGSDEKQLEKVVELSIEKKQAKHDKKEDESQPVADNIQKAISASEASAVLNKDLSVGENMSKKDKVSETPFVNRAVSVPSVPVAEPEIPTSSGREQDRRPKEANVEKEEAKAPRLEKFYDQDAISEVTIVFSTYCRRRL